MRLKVVSGLRYNVRREAHPFVPAYIGRILARFSRNYGSYWLKGGSPRVSQQILTDSIRPSGLRIRHRATAAFRRPSKFDSVSKRFENNLVNRGDRYITRNRTNSYVAWPRFGIMWFRQSGKVRVLDIVLTARFGNGGERPVAYSWMAMSVSSCTTIVQALLCSRFSS